MPCGPSRLSSRAMTAVLATFCVTALLAGCTAGSGGSDPTSPAAAAEPTSAPPVTAASTASATAPGKDHVVGPSTSPFGRQIDLAKAPPPITPAKAVRAARETVGRGTVFGIELDYSNRHDAWAYQVDVQRGPTDYEVHVSARNGKVLSHDHEHADETEKAVSPVRPLSYADALGLAQKRLGAQGRSGRLAGWSLEHDGGHAQYTFEFGDDPDDVDVVVDVVSKRARLDD